MYFNNKLKDGSELKYSAAQIHVKCVEVKKKNPQKTDSIKSSHICF